MVAAERKPAWVVRVWIDDQGKRKTEKAAPGTSWVKPSHTFLVVIYDKRTGKLRQERILGAGRDAKRAADDRSREINRQFEEGEYAPKTSWSEARRKYEEDELVLGRRESTIADIRAALDRFEALCHPHRLDRITTSTIARFRTARKIGNGRDVPAVGERTVNKDLRYLRAFFYKLEEWELIARAPIISLIREPESDRGPYSEAEMAKLYGAANAAQRPHLSPVNRDLWWRTMILFLWSSGCRQSEVLEIEWQRLEYDFDGHGNSRVELPGRKAKNGKARYLFFTSDVESHLKQLAAALFGDDQPAGKVFVWAHNRRQLIDEIDRIHSEAGVVRMKYRAFHGFRHSCATEVYRKHGPAACQHRLGHSSAKVSERYARSALAGFAAAAAPPMPKLPPPALKVAG